jgi:hypothetical protein
MRILEIKNNKGYFFCSDINNWKEIDQIDKDGIMRLLQLYLKEDSIDMDEYQDELIGNKAQQIIYKSIFNKFSSLNENKTKFKDESERKYLNEIQKYTDSKPQ